MGQHMNVVGPCLSPVSYAVQQFHRPRRSLGKENTKQDSYGGAIVVNPMITRRIVYSPPLSRRLKRTRTQFEDDKGSSDDMITEKKNDKEHKTKKQKLNQPITPIAVGKTVQIRFGSCDTDIMLLASVILTESFGTLVLIKERKSSLPGIPIYSKYWARWRGEVNINDKTTPVLDAIHSAE